MIYDVQLSDRAIDDAEKLMRDEPKAYKKLEKFIEELKSHPYTGTGHPEPLRGDRSGQWSRTITKKHRLVYEVHDDVVVVLVLAAYGHYDDK